MSAPAPRAACVSADGTDASAQPLGPFLEELHRRHRARVAALVRRRIADRGLQEDLVQETFVRAWCAIDSLDPNRPAWPWLATIARRLCADALRAAHRTRERPHGMLPGADPLAEPACRATPFVDPVEACLARERRELCSRALEAVSERHRRLLLLKDLEGWSLEEIGTLEGLPAEAVKSALRRARASFRSSYERLAARLALFSPLALARRLLRQAGTHLRKAALRPLAAQGDPVLPLCTQALNGSLGEAAASAVGGGVAAALAVGVIVSALMGTGPLAHAASSQPTPRVPVTTASPHGSPAAQVDGEGAPLGPSWARGASWPGGPDREALANPATRPGEGSAPQADPLRPPSFSVPAAPPDPTRAQLPGPPGPVGVPEPPGLRTGVPGEPLVGVGLPEGPQRPGAPSAPTPAAPAGQGLGSLTALEPPGAAGVFGASLAGGEGQQEGGTGALAGGPGDPAGGSQPGPSCEPPGSDRPVSSCGCVLLSAWTLPAPAPGMALAASQACTTPPPASPGLPATAA